MAAIVAALLLAVGCGSSGSSEVTVQTGSLSKAEFVEKADAICKAARSEFSTKYASFVEEHKSDIGNAQKESGLISEAVDSIVLPNFETEIEQISELGAPSDYAPKVSSFLNAVQKQLEKMHENPSELSATTSPFKKAEDAAQAAGMSGCAESFD